MSIQQSKNRVRARDPVQLRSVVKSDDKEKKKKKNDGDEAPDISFYDVSDDESYDESDMEDGERYGDRDRRTHDHLMNRQDDQLLDPRFRLWSLRIRNVHKELL